jgi:hypothetical protein
MNKKIVYLSEGKESDKLEGNSGALILLLEKRLIF